VRLQPASSKHQDRGQPKADIANMREPPIEGLLGSNGVNHVFLSKCAFSRREEHPRKLCGSLSHELFKKNSPG
jgi:hypothetical protein